MVLYLMLLRIKQSTFEMTDTNLHIFIVTLSTQDNAKQLQQLTINNNNQKLFISVQTVNNTKTRFKMFLFIHLF